MTLGIEIKALQNNRPNKPFLFFCILITYLSLEKFKVEFPSPSLRILLKNGLTKKQVCRKTKKKTYVSDRKKPRPFCFKVKVISLKLYIVFLTKKKRLIFTLVKFFRSSQQTCKLKIASVVFCL